MSSVHPSLSLLVSMEAARCSSSSSTAANSGGDGDCPHSPALSHLTSPSASAASAASEMSQLQLPQLTPADVVSNDAMDEKQQQPGPEPEPGPQHSSPFDPSEWMPSPLPPLLQARQEEGDTVCSEEGAIHADNSRASAAAKSAGLGGATAGRSQTAALLRLKRRIADLFAHLPDEDGAQQEGAAAYVGSAKRGRGGRRSRLGERPQLWQSGRGRATFTQRFLASPDSDHSSSSSSSDSSSSSSCGSSGSSSSSECSDSDCSECERRGRQLQSGTKSASKTVAAAAGRSKQRKLASPTAATRGGRKTPSRRRCPSGASSKPRESRFVPCRPRAVGQTDETAAAPATSASSSSSSYVPLSKRLTKQLGSLASTARSSSLAQTHTSDDSAASASSVSSISSARGGQPRSSNTSGAGRSRQPSLSLSRITHTQLQPPDSGVDDVSISVDQSALAEELKEQPEWMRDWLTHTLRQAERMRQQEERQRREENEDESEWDKRQTDDANAAGGHGGASSSDDTTAASATACSQPRISSVSDQPAVSASAAALPSVAQLLSCGFDFAAGRRTGRPLGQAAQLSRFVEQAAGNTHLSLGRAATGLQPIAGTRRATMPIDPPQHLPRVQPASDGPSVILHLDDDSDEE